MLGDGRVRLRDDEGDENNCFITPLAFRGVIGGWCCCSCFELDIFCLGESTNKRRRPSWNKQQKVSFSFENQPFELNILSCECNDVGGFNNNNGLDADRISSGLGEYFCASRTKRRRT